MSRGMGILPMKAGVADHGRDPRATETVLLGHGGGGRLMTELIERVFLPGLRNPVLERMGDSALCSLNGHQLALTTDAFVVQPLFFPGGDIGRLAVCGTVNDLVMAGARPLYLTASFILEEGLEIDKLSLIVESMRRAAQEAEVEVVAGDTKVVPRGAADGCFITTSGVGLVSSGLSLRPELIEPGDAVLVSGPVGDHGAAVLAAREGFELEVPVVSDCAPLWPLVRELLGEGQVRVMRDPTRGGLAAVLCELAEQSGRCLEIEESAIPVQEPVRALCELLGLDYLSLANEGKLVAVVAGGQEKWMVNALRSQPAGEQAALIGRAVEGPPGRVHLRTPAGALRILECPLADPLPRIC